MKKYFFLFIVILVCSFSMYAQDFATKGDIEMGGSFGFTSKTNVSIGNTADESSVSFRFEPYVGFFFIKNFELGIIPAITFDSPAFSNWSTVLVEASVAPAWNFDLKSIVYPFIEIRTGINYQIKSSKGGSTETSAGFLGALRGGIKLQVGSNALVNFSMYYTAYSLTQENHNNRDGYNQFGIMGGFTIFLNK